jgi:hypothetical protein
MMDCFVVSVLHKELPSSGLTGRSSMRGLFDSIIGVAGILDHPLEPVIELAEGETRWRVMTVTSCGSRGRDRP